jgi:hypothetical protein
MRRLRLTVVLVLLGVAAYFSATFATSPTAPEYTIRQIETARTYDNSKPPLQVVRLYAQRKDGAFIGREEYMQNGKLCRTDSIHLPTIPARVAVDSCVKMKSTYPVTQAVAAEWKAVSPSDCTRMLGGNNYRNLGTFQIHGVTVQRLTSENGAQIFETNPSPQLGCKSVRDVYRWKNGQGEITSETVVDTTEVKLDTPDAELFVIPGDYREAKPSEVRNAMAMHLRGTIPSTEYFRDVNDKADSQYAKARADVGK